MTDELYIKKDETTSTITLLFEKKITDLGPRRKYYLKFKETFKEYFSHYDHDIQSFFEKERNPFVIDKTHEVGLVNIAEDEPLHTILAPFLKEGWFTGGLVGLVYVWNATDFVEGTYLSPMIIEKKLGCIHKTKIGGRSELMFLLNTLLPSKKEYKDNQLLLFREKK